METNRTRNKKKSHLPLVDFAFLLHRGFLDRPAKPSAGDSLEGCLLSCAHSHEVSEAWESIAEIGGRPVWCLRPASVGGFTLLDWHSLTKRQRSALLVKAEGLGLVKRCVNYEVTWFDDEIDGDRYILVSDRHEAEEEAEMNGAKIKKVRGWAALEPLVAFWNSRHGGKDIELALVEEAAIICLLESAEPKIDGVYWDDDFDELGLSAPRAGLFQRVVATAKKALSDGDEDECGS